MNKAKYEDSVKKAVEFFKELGIEDIIIMYDLSNALDKFVPKLEKNEILENGDILATVNITNEHISQTRNFNVGSLIVFVSNMIPEDKRKDIAAIDLDLNDKAVLLGNYDNKDLVDVGKAVEKYGFHFDVSSLEQEYNSLKNTECFTCDRKQCAEYGDKETCKNSK